MNLILSLFSFILSLGLTKLFSVKVYGTLLMDKPNDRSMHSRPTVRGGGLIFIALGWCSIPLLCFLTATSIFDPAIFILTICIFVIAAVSFIDDMYHLSVKKRFLAQSATALLVALFFYNDLDFGVTKVSNVLFIIPFIFFSVIWAINHFNFMDGLDGFCASQAIFILSAYAILFGLSNAWFYQGFCLVLVFSLLGFLIFNFPPARLFMGDVGSATLGFIIFFLALIAQNEYQISIVYWFMLNGLFLFDATFTLLRRVINKEKWSSPHKKHAYQRIRQSGISVSMILFGQLLINGSFLFLVLAVHFSHFYWELLLFQIGFMFLIYCLIEKKSPMILSDLTL